MLQLKNVVKKYKLNDFTQIALNQVSMDFRENEFVAILGQSGSGKTTLLNIIGGLDRYDSGDLIINGKSTQQFKDSDWDAYRNNSVGFIFQSYNLISHLSVLDNVEIGMTLSGVSKTEKKKKALAALERVGLTLHKNKKPSQLSGGQMQRVAIARALANNPDIILADEPTGALDSETSEQIMQLIQEIAKDKLVIMVTHNAEIAEKYADRIVKLSDGKLISDSNPATEAELNTNYTLKRTSMSFFTALKLSWKNIGTKRWRTGLTAFASSIGIIGVTLVLSLSNGFNIQIGNVESSTLSGYPLTVSAGVSSQNFRRPSSTMLSGGTTITTTDATAIYPYDYAKDSVTHTNTLTQEYLDYIEAIDPTLLLGVNYNQSVNMNLLSIQNKLPVSLDASAINFSVFPKELNSSSSKYIETNYDLLAGSYPTQMSDLVLVLDEENKIDKSIIAALGLDGDAASLTYESLIGYTFKAIPNDLYYAKQGHTYTINGTNDELIAIYNNEAAITLKIVGVIRPNADAQSPAVTAGIAYSNALSDYFLVDSQKSAIVAAQQSVEYNILTGAPFSSTSSSAATGLAAMSFLQPGNTNTKTSVLANLGASGIPQSISLYPTDFTTKQAVITYLDNWNTNLSDENKIVYSDLSATFTDSIGSVLDAVTLVLIAFASISLFVSLIMIGIITYISVLERTKEIGVLRSLGARKKDITRVFNAETFIIGTASGLLGVGLAYLLTIPVNNILFKLTDLKDVALINPIHAALLFGFSIVLAMLGGLLPARMAAQKDPVAALRSE